jgi:hypothetical protein
MKNKWFALVLVLVLLLTSAGSAFAQAPSVPQGEDQIDCYYWWDGVWYSPDYGGAPLIIERYWPFYNNGFSTNFTWKDDLDRMLGDSATLLFPLFNPNGFPATYWPVDIYMWRPPTMYMCYDWGAGDWIFPGEAGHPNFDEGFYWPFVWNPQTPDTWFKKEWENPDGARRQSWPTFQETDGWGFYYAKFMLPRDEVWYPCGYPCKWQCNYYNPWTNNYVWHSPYAMAMVYPPAVPFTAEWYYPLFYPLYWPYLWDENYGWVDSYDPGYWDLVRPMDTVGPVTLWPVEATFDSLIEFQFSPPWGEYEILGYYWKTSDLGWQHWPDDWPYLCEDHEWYPNLLVFP